MALGPYLRFVIASGIATFAGAQTVHVLFRPLEDLDDLVEMELKKRREAQNT